jgi:hypothetical protein
LNLCSFCMIWWNDRNKFLSLLLLFILCTWNWSWGHAAGGAVVGALRYKPEGRGKDSRWCHWNF